MKIPPQMRWLPRTKRGVPVPYVAHWTSEEGKARLEPFASEGFTGPCITHDDLRGQGEPVLGRMSYRRQREVVLAKRCQVCRRKLRMKAYVLLNRPRVSDPGQFFNSFLIDEPPCCRSCMSWCLTNCPGIARGLGSQTATIARVRTWTVVGVTVRPVGDQYLDAAFAPLTAFDMPNGALGYLKLAFDTVEPWWQA